MGVFFPEEELRKSRALSWRLAGLTDQQRSASSTSKSGLGVDKALVPEVISFSSTTPGRFRVFRTSLRSVKPHRGVNRSAAVSRLAAELNPGGDPAVLFCDADQLIVRLLKGSGSVRFGSGSYCRRESLSREC